MKVAKKTCKWMKMDENDIWWDIGQWLMDGRIGWKCGWKPFCDNGLRHRSGPCAFSIINRSIWMKCT